MWHVLQAVLFPLAVAVVTLLLWKRSKVLGMQIQKRQDAHLLTSSLQHRADDSQQQASECYTSV